MSDLRKAIEELADKWQARGEHLKAYSAQFPAEVAETLHDDGADMVHNAAILRALLAANPEPEPEWEIVKPEDGKGPKLESEYEYWNGWFRRPRTAPGQRIAVTDDE